MNRLCDNFFAGSGLSSDQDRNIKNGGLFDGRLKLTHGWGVVQKDRQRQWLRLLNGIG